MNRRPIFLLAAHTLLAIVFIFFISPLIWLVISAFDPEASTEFRIPSTITLKWFNSMFEPLGGVREGVLPVTWIINSLIIATATATLVTLLAILSGYSLARYKFKGQSAVVKMFVILRLMPAMVVALPIVIIYAKLNLLDTFHGLVLALSALILPFALLIADGYFRALPTEFEEAAMIDGCSRFTAFVRVTLPLALPGVVTIWLLSFVTAWGEFLLPLVMMRSPYTYPAAVGIYYWFGVYGRVEYGRISAFSLLFSLPTVLIFLVSRKFLARGISGLVVR